MKLTPSIPLGTALIAESLPALAERAQAVYDLWEQDDDGMDDAYAAGGICHDIASALVEGLLENGVEEALAIHASVGENHVFAVALFDDGVYEIDIPPSVYESGSGYVWRKKPGVVFGPASFAFARIAGPMSAEEFREAYSD
jgi:hypothetical protein